MRKSGNIYIFYGVSQDYEAFFKINTKHISLSHLICSLFRRIHNYNLERSFCLQEQQITIHYIFPFSLIHSCSFLVYLTFFLTNRQFLNNNALSEKQKFFYGELNSLVSFLFPWFNFKQLRIFRVKPYTLQWCLLHYWFTGVSEAKNPNNG